MLLENRTALVTGAAGRLGKAIAEVYLREGAKVMLADIDATRLTALANELGARHPGRVASVAGDPATKEDAVRFVAVAEETLGLPDILAHAHGIFPNCSMLDVT
ncbi:SDR family NAD(P)-dependent oxidoreductase, partial [Rhizobiaceae sp. 2RAB30]